MSLSCPDGMFLRIEEVNGRRSNGMCGFSGSDSNDACPINDAFWQIANACFGASNCAVTPDATLLTEQCGDPEGDMYFDVDYLCEGM